MITPSDKEGKKETRKEERKERKEERKEERRRKNASPGATNSLPKLPQAMPQPANTAHSPPPVRGVSTETAANVEIHAPDPRRERQSLQQVEFSPNFEQRISQMIERVLAHHTNSLPSTPQESIPSPALGQVPHGEPIDGIKGHGTTTGTRLPVVH